MSKNKQYGILIDYYFCTGCHGCEVACKSELDLPTGQYGIKLSEDGPRKKPDGKWELTYMPIPTELCNLCEKRVSEGRLPTCVHHCQSACMDFGPIEELAKKMTGKTRQVLFVPAQSL